MIPEVFMCLVLLFDLCVQREEVEAPAVWGVVVL